MQIASKLKMENIASLASAAFYGLAGLVLLILLPFSGFPPHVGLLGIVSLATAYGIFMKRKWAIWLVAALFFVVSTFTLYTLYYVIATDVVASASMLVYAVLTWAFTIYIVIKRKAQEA
jgi:hypothetical protein